MKKVLLVDNYDSFTYNLADLFGQLGCEVLVKRNDAITPDEAEALEPSHLVSEVVGELEPDVSHFDLLRACFPAGTVSGAPKVRAMQLIAELEGYRRGPYAGAVLYALPGEALDACIAIRTVVLHDGVALLQAGAGIVADSDPAAEHDECLRKLAALEMAIELAEARSA